MTAVLMRRTISGLAADDEAATDVLRRIPVGNVVRVDVRRPRNLSAHRRYWALVNLVYSNSDVYASTDAAHGHIKLLAGEADTVMNRDTGETFLIPKSISFSAMDEDAFQDFWKRAVKAVVEHILPGVTAPEVEMEVLQLIGHAGGMR